MQVTVDYVKEIISEAINYGNHSLPYGREDVLEILHFEEQNASSGEPDWVILFKTLSNQYAVFHGGHDYTGWD